MRIRSGLALVLFARLALATVALAQVVDADVEPARSPVGSRVEVGVTTGATIGMPELGVIGSIPLDRGASLDLIVTHMPRSWVGTSHLLGQAQFRLPFRAELRSRRSVVFGVTRIAAGGSRRFLGDFATFTRPHAGVSLQWPIGRGADFRLDAQGILTFAGDLPMLPRAMAAVVWHTKPAPRLARATRGRS